MLIARLGEDGTRIEAVLAAKGPSFTCPGCGEPVTLAKGRIRRPYFGHWPGAVCSYAALETWEHQQAKEDFAAAYRARSLACDVEVEVLSIDGDRRADVLLHAPDDAWRSSFSTARWAMPPSSDGQAPISPPESRLSGCRSSFASASANRAGSRAPTSSM